MHVFKKRRKDLWDSHMHMRLIDEAQTLFDDDFMDGITLKRKKTLNGTMSETWTFGMINKPW